MFHAGLQPRSFPALTSFAFQHVFVRTQVYDSEGRVLMALFGHSKVYGGHKGSVHLNEMVWQPHAATRDARLLEDGDIA
eukprot:18446-Eustigmatos_ZCMA.PRE.1